MYKRLLLAFALMLSLVVSPFAVPSAKAVVANTLVRIDGNPTVYWYANDGRRYVFPNARTFYSWFSDSDLANVLAISPQELGSISIGGNVTYRPGVRLIKITTDPRVYAVSRYGTLRWVTSEALAAQLYGPNWAQQIDDVPDEFFVNYHNGDPIYNASQFNVQFEMGQARSPSDNIQTGNWPTAPQSPYNPPANTGNLVGSVILSASTQTPVNQSVTFTATAYNPSVVVQDATLAIYRADTGELLRSCQGFTCSYTTNGVFGLSNGVSYYYFARLTNIRTGATLNSNVVTITPQVSNGDANTSSQRPTILITNSGPVPSQPRLGDTVTVTVFTGTQTVQNGTLSVIDPGGNTLRSCQNVSSCSYTFVMDQAFANGMRGQVYNFRGYFTPSGSSSYYSSVTAGIFPPANTSTNVPATALNISFDRSSIRSGEAFVVTANLTPASSGAPYYTIRIYDQWNALQLTCERVRTCVLQQTLSQTSDTSRTYYAVATGDNGQSLSSGNQTITVVQTPSTTYGRLNGATLTYTKSGDSVSLDPDFTVMSGASVTMGAEINPAPSNSNGFTIRILQADGTVIQTCTNVPSCSVTKSFSASGTSNSSYGFKAHIEDMYGSVYDTPVTYVIVRPNNTLSGTIGAGISASTISSGQEFRVNARVSNSNVSDQNLKISWYQSSNDALMSYCEGVNPCIITTSYPAIGGQSRTMSFYAKATDRTGAMRGEIVGPPVTITITP